jgi:hypothetical protein
MKRPRIKIPNPKNSKVITANVNDLKENKHNFVISSSKQSIWKGRVKQKALSSDGKVMLFVK